MKSSQMLETVRKPLGYLFIALGAVVAVQYVAFAFYLDVGDGLPFRVWTWINYTTLVGAPLAVIVAYARWRDYDRSNTYDAIIAGTMFMFAGAYAIMFYEQKFTSLFLLEEGENLSGYRALGWIILDTTWPVLSAWIASWLLRSGSTNHLTRQDH